MIVTIKDYLTDGEANTLKTMIELKGIKAGVRVQIPAYIAKDAGFFYLVEVDEQDYKIAKNVIDEFDKIQLENQNKLLKENASFCPKCDSENVQSNGINSSPWTGNNTLNKCKKCGYEWKSKRNIG